MSAPWHALRLVVCLGLGIACLPQAQSAESPPGQWKAHRVRQLQGAAPSLWRPARMQIVTESWNRVVAVPYITYLAEKDRVLMLVSCDYPHHPMMLESADRGATWSEPRNAGLDGEGKVLPALGTSLQNLGEGKLVFYAAARWFSHDFGATWGEPVPIAPALDGKTWAIWDPPLVEQDPQSGRVVRLVETGYTGTTDSHQRAYWRESLDGGRTWGEAHSVPEWNEVSEVALIRAGNGDLVAACRTDMPARMRGDIDHAEGLGISISKDNGTTWSKVQSLYDHGRHHPSLVRLPGDDLLMTYVVRQGYPDTKIGFRQFGIEAVVSRDHGATWDLDNRFILHHWTGTHQGPTHWWPSSQATSTVLLPDGTLLTAFGTGYRSQKDANGQSSPRDVGLIAWQVDAVPLEQRGPASPVRGEPFDPAAGTDDETPVYEIRRTGTPIVIDGKLDEPAWFAAPDVGEFHFTWHREGRKERTVAKLLWDDENLYVAHVCEDAHITARHVQHDGPIPEDDCFEVIFAPDPAHPDVYFNVEWNVIGGYVDNHRPDGPKKPKAKVWDAEGVRIAGTYVGTLNDDSDADGGWTAEVAIPLRNFAKFMPHLPPRPGSHWNLNLNRHGGKTNMQYSQWSRADTPAPNFHTPHRFGKGVFSAKTSPFSDDAAGQK